MSPLAIPLGLAAVLGGVYLAAGGTRRLRRRGVFRGNFWASAGEYFGYRVRALGPLLRVVAGLALLLGGAILVYLGLVDFYSARFGSPRP